MSEDSSVCELGKPGKDGEELCGGIRWALGPAALKGKAGRGQDLAAPILRPPSLGALWQRFIASDNRICTICLKIPFCFFQHTGISVLVRSWRCSQCISESKCGKNNTLV